MKNIHDKSMPDFLRPGDNVKIISTARKVTLEELEPAIKTLKSWGLKVFYGDNLFQSENQFSGDDSKRLFDLQAALDDIEIKAIFVPGEAMGHPG